MQNRALPFERWILRVCVERLTTLSLVQIALTGFAEDHDTRNPNHRRAHDYDHSGSSSSSKRAEEEDTRDPRDAVDSWLVKGGKSLAVILREIKNLEDELISGELEAAATRK